ncbi:hypothetical protein HDK90DRAFT_259504 [Phyllosticta capitalensis]|uniref:Uncharacterized protein n=1 Tax=Phyllosticta capitalensis TaxID=121624 RepID=A0ABR1YRT1_9PEZI
MVLPGDRPRQYKSLPRPPLGAITSLSSALHPPRCLSRCLSTSATDDSARCRPWYCRAIAHASTKDLHRPSASIPRRLVHRLHLLSTPLSRRPSTNAMAGTSLSQTRRWVNQEIQPRLVFRPGQSLTGAPPGPSCHHFLCWEGRRAESLTADRLYTRPRSPEAASTGHFQSPHSNSTGGRK